jgi:primosomal protein N' (replication factor Y)
MNVIEIVPISRNSRVETLSYFTSENPPIGALVDAPLRSKIVHGIVAAVRPVSEMKSDLKTAGFSLKKIDKVKARSFLPAALIRTAIAEADYAGATLGTTLKSMVHDSIFEAADKLTFVDRVSVPKRSVLALQGDDEDRYGAYRSMIRQEFARKKSVLFLAPTAEEAEYLHSVLQKGVEKYIFLLHSSLSTKKITETWNSAVELNHPVVVVATGSFIAFMRPDIETLVIERESMRGWKNQRRPYLDLRHVIETYAEKSGLKLFIADLALRLETSRRQDQGEIETGSLYKARSISSARDAVVDMKKYKGGASFRILSEEAEAIIKKTRDENAHCIVIAARKGLAPSTVCGDCHTIVTCNNCGSPVVLHENKTFADNGQTYFLCHHCGERRSTEEYCKTCGSWKLATVGIGIDLVRKKIADLFPGIKIFQLDSDTTPTPKKIHDVIEKFKANPGSVLLGTELLMNYYHEKIAYAVVVTLDSLLSVPDFRISERIFYMLLRLRAITDRELVIQTRKPEEPAFEAAAKGNITNFVRAALDERKQFGWPPYSNLIKISIDGKRDAIAEQMEKIKEFLAPVEIEVFPSFTAGTRGNSLLHALIRLPSQPAGNWPNPELSSKLRALAPSITVNVDPESLL